MFRIATLEDLHLIEGYANGAAGLTGSLARTLDAEQVATLAHLHVLSWLTANFDIRRNPNGLSRGPFRRFWKAVQAGEVRVDWPRLARFVEHAMMLPDPALESVLRPLARERLGAREARIARWLGDVQYRSEAEYLFGVLFRKRSLRADTARFVESLNDEDMDVRFSLPVPRPGARPRKERGTLELDIAPARLAFEPGPARWGPGAWAWAHAVSVVDRVRGGFTLGQAAGMRFGDLNDGFPLRERLNNTSPAVLDVLRERAQYVAASASDPRIVANASQMVRILRDQPRAGWEPVTGSFAN